MRRSHLEPFRTFFSRLEQQATADIRQTARKTVETLRDLAVTRTPEEAAAVLSTLGEGRAHLDPKVLVSLHQGGVEGGAPEGAGQEGGRPEGSGEGGQEGARPEGAGEGGQEGAGLAGARPETGSPEGPGPEAGRPAGPQPAAARPEESGDIVLAQEAAADLAEHFVVGRQQFFEALDAGTDINLDLKQGLARALNEPHLETIIDNLTAEPSQVIRERAAEMKRLMTEDNPFEGLEDAVVREIKPETVLALARNMEAAGMPYEKAEEAVRIFARGAARLLTAWGVDPNDFLANRIRFARAGEEGGATYHQDAFGEAFADFRGRPAEAIEHLLKEKRGYVPGAFYREKLGDIDLPWGATGENGFGLAHIIEQREAAGYDGETFARSLPRIIQEGRVEQRPDHPGRAYIVHEESEAVIRLDWDGQKRTWLLTAYPWTKENAHKTPAGLQTSDRTHGDGQHLPPSRFEGVELNIDELFKNDKTFFQSAFQPAPSVDSPAFKNWSEGAPVLDEEAYSRIDWEEMIKWDFDDEYPNGVVFRVYHGTDEGGIEKFELRRSRDIGVHFGSSEQANSFAERGAVYPVYIKMKKPAVVTDFFSTKDMEDVRAALGQLTDQSIIDWHERDRLTHLAEKIWAKADAWAASGKDPRDFPLKNYKPFWKEVITALKDAGVDGLIYLNHYEGQGWSFSVLNPTQIKSVHNRGTFDPSDPRILYQFAGERSNMSAPVRRGLAEARRLDESGTDNEAIRHKTGWFKGMDGKWRYEIPDHASYFNLPTDFSNPFLSRKLGDIYHNEALYEAYPDLKDMPVEFRDKSGDTSASYHPPRPNRAGEMLEWITLNTNGEDMRFSLLHEIQHAIQEREDFARGGEMSMFNERVLREWNDMRAEADALRNGEAGELLRQWDRPVSEKEKSSPEYKHERERLEARLKKEHPDAFERYQEIFRRTPEYFANTRQYSLYQSLAGEIEARDTAQRMGYNERNRKVVRPDLRRDAIVIFGGEAVASLSLDAPGPAGPRGRLDVLSDGSFLVSFTQAADASTPIHEAAHMFVELARQVLASHPDQVADWAAFEQVQGDLKKLADWAGQADPYGEWTREAHEKLARGFETYLMEGRPPIEGLRGLFERMKAWLLDIYKDLKNLGAPLNDEVREVFDRLVAADWELALDPLREGAPEGLAPEIENALAEPRAKARQAREEAVANKRLAEINRLRREWVKEARQMAREMPGRQWIKTIREQGGISVDSLKALGYAPEDIQALARRFPGLISSKSRVGLDELGQMHGFEYGDDFYQALKNLPTEKDVIDGHVAEMEELHADWSGEPPALTKAEINLMELEAVAEQHRDNPTAAVEAIRKTQERAEQRRLKAEEAAARKNVEELLGVNSKEQLAALKEKIAALNEERTARRRAEEQLETQAREAAALREELTARQEELATRQKEVADLERALADWPMARPEAERIQANEQLTALREQTEALKAELERRKGDFQRGANEGFNWGTAIERASADHYRSIVARTIREKLYDQADRFRAEQERKNEIKKTLARFGKLVNQKWAKLNRAGGLRGLL